MELICKAPIHQSVATLQDLVDRNSDNSLHFPLPSVMVTKLNEIANFQTPRIILQFGRGSVIGILDTVRNMVLDWAIQMEREGVSGHGISFEQQEKIQAQQAMTTFNIRKIGNFVGNLGSGNACGDLVTSIDTVNKIKDFINKIKSSHSELVASGVDGEQLSSKLAEIEAAVNVEQPEKGLLKGLLEDA